MRPARLSRSLTSTNRRKNKGGRIMTRQNEFDVTIKAGGIDIDRKVDEDVGRRIVSILLGAAENGKDENHTGGDSAGKAERPSAAVGREAFFAGLKNGKPSDNALATAAY